LKYSLLIILILTGFVYDDDVSLFRIIQNNKTGYINSQGEIIIEPIFADAQDFSNGLAPARIAGKYGYINSNGDFVINSKYDYAMEFKNGTAMVFNDSVPSFLFLDGREIKFPNYRAITFLEPERAYVYTNTKKTGVIDLKGNLVIDTIYSWIDLRGKFAIVGDFRGEANERERVALIDSSGKIMIPFGKYTEIWNFERGCAKVYFPSEGKQYIGFINEKGDHLISRVQDGMKSKELSSCINDSTFVELYNDSITVVNGRSSKDDYYGIINSKGESVVKNFQWAGIIPISENLCYVRLRDSYSYILIDAAGNKINSDTFTYFDKSPYDSHIVVAKNNQYALMDLSLKYLIPFQDHQLGSNYIGKEYFYYASYNRANYYWGLSDFLGKIIIQPGPYLFETADFKNGLIIVTTSVVISKFVK